MNILKMKNVFKFICIAVVICVASIINVTATSLSNNDGSAFITKAEFDSLKNNFQSQIDSYNQSIDSKIDSAIASYLSGVNIAKEVTKNVYFAWDDVTCIYGDDGYIAPTFEYPSYSVTTYFSNDWRTSGYNGAFDVIYNVKYTQNTGSRRPIVNGITEAATIDKTNAVWGGIAKSVYEGWAFSYNAMGSTSVGYIRNNANGLECRKYMVNGYNGYYPNFLTTSQIIKPNVRWTYPKGTGTSTNKSIDIPAPTKYSNSVSLQIRSDSSGKEYDHEHIISWKKDDTFYASNVQFTKTFATVGDSNSTIGKWDAKLTKVGQFNAIEVGRDSGGNFGFNQKDYKQVCDFNDNQTTTLVIPRIGMMKDKFKYSEVKQHNQTLSSSLGGKSFNINPPKINNGLQAFFEEKDSEVTWDLEFSSNTWVGDGGEVKAWLSLSKFDEEPIESSCIDVTTNTDSTVRKYAKTDGKKVTLKFKMPDTGLVWLKWRPSDDASVSSTSTTPWEVTLDYEKSRNYKVKAADK